MGMIDLKRLADGGDGAFVQGVAVADEALNVTTWVLGPHRRLPEMAFSRSVAAYLVLEGALRIELDGETHVVETGQLLSVGKRVRHRALNATDEPTRVVVMRAPGRPRLEDPGIGRVECPACAGLMPLEKGDRAGDRFVCIDCGYVMTLVNSEGGLRPARLEPESANV